MTCISLYLLNHPCKLISPWLGYMYHGRQFFSILKFATGIKDAVGILDGGKLSAGRNRALAMPKLWHTAALRS